MVPRRPLAGTDIDLPCLGLGTVKFGRNDAVKYPTRFDLPNDSEVTALLEQCQEAGIDFLDTAPAYGNSESRLGRLLPGRRQDWLLCSKAGETFVNGQSIFDFSGTAIQGSVEQSLKNLKTDYLDMVLVHSNGDDLDIIEHSDALETLQVLKHAASRSNRGILIKKALNSGHAVAAESLRFVLDQDAVTSAVIGTISPEHLQTNIDTVLSI